MKSSWKIVILGVVIAGVLAPMIWFATTSKAPVHAFIFILILTLTLASAVMLALTAAGWLLSLFLNRFAGNWFEPRRAKYRQTLRVGALGGGAILALVLIVHAVFTGISSLTLNDELAALRAAGEPVQLADLARPPIPPETNAATYLQRAKESIKAINQELKQVYDQEHYKRQNRLNEADCKAIRAAFAAYPQLMPLLEQVAACADFDSGMDYSADFTHELMQEHLDGIQEFRAVLTLLKARALQLSTDGERDSALQACLLMFRLSRHTDREAFLVGFLVSCACRAVAAQTTGEVLYSGPVGDALRQTLEAELAGHDVMKAYGESLRWERVAGLTLFRDQIPWISRIIVFGRDQSYYLDMMAEQLRLAGRPYAEAAAAFERRRNESGMTHALSSLMVPAIDKTRDAAEGCVARLRCLRVLNALQRELAKNPAAEPRLADLPLPAEVKLDPFTGDPLRIKKTAGGYVVYSVAKNLKDDGGDFEKAKDIGLGPPK